MKAFASLTNRIFVATAMLAVLSITAAFYIVNRAVTGQAEDELRRGLDRAARQVDAYRNILFDNFKRDARFIADLPKLKAALDSNSDPNTVQGVAEEYKEQLPGADLFAISDQRGRLLVKIGAAGVPDQALAAAMQSSGARGSTTAFPQTGSGILLVTSVPVPDPSQPVPLGTLSVGASWGEAQAQRFKSLSDSEIAFGMDGAIQAATMPPRTWPALAPLLSSPGYHDRTIDGDEYLAIVLPLSHAGAKTQPVSVVLRSRTERLSFLRPLRTQLVGTAVLAVLIAILLSYAIARTVTRPLGTITTTMREMAASGDLTRRIPLATEARWQDEDAHLLATTFNSMTDSIQRFQRDAAQRERLSSLGRLSTVVAHEIRNPLMIIKTALRGLRRDDVKPERVHAAVRDIDEEIARLNRIVTEVLDFARPIKFDLAEADLNAVAADAVKAAAVDGDRHPVRLGLDPRIPPMTTDAERLRQVLVNVLSNAAQAVDARPPAPSNEPPIRLETHRLDGSHVVITVRDRGVGIAPEHLARVFDPYFTTRRTGTGIGLAISRNIVEGLGGRITVSSQVERGTEVRIELPLHPMS
jgi:signal transduction histidine kinase